MKHDDTRFSRSEQSRGADNHKGADIPPDLGHSPASARLRRRDSDSPIIEGAPLVEREGVSGKRLTLRLDEVVAALGVSRRSIERERAAGRFPKPDLMLGRMPLWRPETLRAWVERGGQS